VNLIATIDWLVRIEEGNRGLRKIRLISIRPSAELSTGGYHLQLNFMLCTLSYDEPGGKLLANNAVPCPL
jgi:hypothetical protein